MKVSDHFGNVAVNYNTKRSRGILSYLVNKETQILIKNLDPNPNELILDAGCGSGFYSKLIFDKGARVAGIDISKNMIKEYRANKFIGVVGNLEYLPFSIKFDKILCAGALEFVSNPNKTIREFNSVLKNNGILVLLYPRFNLFGILYYLYHRTHGIKINLFCNITNILNGSNFRVVSKGNSNLLTTVVIAVKE